MQVTRYEVLKLYKNLIIYSRGLSFTDPAYFKRKISTEFKNNKSLTKPEDISFAYNVKHYYAEALLSKHIMQLLNKLGLCRISSVQHLMVALKHIDYSRVPKINEIDLNEQFVRGGGPGGSAVNKNANCVVLTHIPTGIVVKCHMSRCQDENRKVAREMIIAKLDEKLNGADSVAGQKKKIEEKKYKRSQYKRKKMAELKSEWKKREGLT